MELGISLVVPVLVGSVEDTVNNTDQCTFE